MTVYDEEDGIMYNIHVKHIWSGWVEGHPDIRAEAESIESLSKILKTRLIAKLDAKSNAWDAEIAEDAISGALQAMIDDIRKEDSNVSRESDHV